MFLMALAYATATTSPVDTPLTCAVTNGSFGIERFALSADAKAGIKFASMGGLWSAAVTGGNLVSSDKWQAQIVLTSSTKVFRAKLDRGEWISGQFRISISEVRAGIDGPVTIAVGLCRADTASTKSLKPLPKRGALPPLVSNGFTTPTSFRNTPPWGMTCALTDSSGLRRDISLILQPAGFSVTYRFFDAPWLERRIGAVDLPTILGPVAGAGFGGKRRLQGGSYSDPAPYNHDIGIVWDFDYFNEGGEEPEIDLALYVPGKSGGQLFAGMCKWVSAKIIEQRPEL